jgi:hypothetical protein
MTALLDLLAITVLLVAFNLMLPALPSAATAQT